MYGVSGVEIEGTADTLRQFSQEIQELDGSRRINFPDATGADSRGLQYASAITISLNSELVNITVIEGGIVISGSKEKLSILAQNIDFLAEAKRETPSNNSNHIHIEYFPGDFPFLAESAEPLIVTNSDLRIASHPFS
jgi:hypothetical protein